MIELYDRFLKYQKVCDNVFNIEESYKLILNIIELKYIRLGKYLIYLLNLPHVRAQFERLQILANRKSENWLISVERCRSSSTTGVPQWLWWGRTASPLPAIGDSGFSSRPSPPISRGFPRSTTSFSSVSPASPPTLRRSTSALFSATNCISCVKRGI